MNYSIVFSKKALKQLKKLDKYTVSLIAGWLRKNIEGCTDPRIHGKGSTSNRSGEWRYRVGNYRFIVEIKDEQVTVLDVAIGHDGL